MRLSFSEREEISVYRAAGEGVRAIARRLSRSPSTVSRELARGTVRRKTGYRASVAQARADTRARRPKPSVLACNARLRDHVQDRLSRKHSPEQISRRLRLDFPDEPEMWVSHETIYRALYVQGRGALRRELVKCLRTGRALRKRAAVSPSGGDGSRTWSTSASGLRKPTTAPCPATGRAT
jgi:IS30 family transposase